MFRCFPDRPIDGDGVPQTVRGVKRNAAGSTEPTSRTGDSVGNGIADGDGVGGIWHAGASLSGRAAANAPTIPHIIAAVVVAV